MKNLASVLFVLISVNVFGQSHYSAEQQDSVFNEYMSKSVYPQYADYGDWIRNEENPNIIIYLGKQNAVGYKKALDIFNNLLNDFDVQSNVMTIDKTFYPSYVDGLNDYNSMNTALIVGSAQVVYATGTKVGDELTYVISIQCSEDRYMVSVTKM